MASQSKHRFYILSPDFYMHHKFLSEIYVTPVAKYSMMRVYALFILITKMNLRDAENRGNGYGFYPYRIPAPRLSQQLQGTLNTIPTMCMP